MQSTEGRLGLGLGLGLGFVRVRISDPRSIASSANRREMAIIASSRQALRN